VNGALSSSGAHATSHAPPPWFDERLRRKPQKVQWSAAEIARDFDGFCTAGGPSQQTTYTAGWSVGVGGRVAHSRNDGKLRLDEKCNAVQQRLKRRHEMAPTEMRSQQSQ
jgi:hypothetical protein